MPLAYYAAKYWQAGYLLPLSGGGEESSSPPTTSRATTSGGKPKRRKYAGYPRWILVSGSRYRVESPDDERNLLERLAAQARADEALSAAASNVVELREARTRRVRVENRIERVDPRAADWHEKLRREDDEILQIMGFIGVTADE